MTGSHPGYISPGVVHGIACDATPERYSKAAVISPGTEGLTDSTNARGTDSVCIRRRSKQLAAFDLDR